MHMHMSGLVPVTTVTARVPPDAVAASRFIPPAIIPTNSSAILFTSCSLSTTPILLLLLTLPFLLPRLFFFFFFFDLICSIRVQKVKEPKAFLHVQLLTIFSPLRTCQEDCYHFLLDLKSPYMWTLLHTLMSYPIHLYLQKIKSSGYRGRTKKIICCFNHQFKDVPPICEFNSNFSWSHPSLSFARGENLLTLVLISVGDLTSSGRPPVMSPTLRFYMERNFLTRY